MKFGPIRKAILVMPTVLVAAITSPVIAEDARTPSANRLMVPLLDLNGNIHNLTQNDHGVARVFLFLSAECPVSNSYLQPLTKLRQTIDTKNVQFFGVITDANVNLEQAAKHFTDYRFNIPVLFDPTGHLADFLKPTHVPEAFVLDASDAVVYRGSIDDTWGSVGRRRSGPSTCYIRNAIDAVVQGGKVAVAETKPVGCLFESFSEEGDESEVTFNRDIAPIIYSRCLNCHREGQVAPFALETYQQVAKRAEWIASVTQDRIMPPWIPHRGHEKFVGERWLSDGEMLLVKRWADSACAATSPTFRRNVVRLSLGRRSFTWYHLCGCGLDCCGRANTASVGPEHKCAVLRESWHGFAARTNSATASIDADTTTFSSSSAANDGTETPKKATRMAIERFELLSCVLQVGCCLGSSFATRRTLIPIEEQQ